jgi:hypothetical protein
MAHLQQKLLGQKFKQIYSYRFLHVTLGPRRYRMTGLRAAVKRGGMLRRDGSIALRRVQRLLNPRLALDRHLMRRSIGGIDSGAVCLLDVLPRPDRRGALWYV